MGWTKFFHFHEISGQFEYFRKGSSYVKFFVLRGPEVLFGDLCFYVKSISYKMESLVVVFRLGT